MHQDKILLACDLDRTVLPNGKQHFSTKSIDLFKEFLDKSKVILVYISGRDLKLIQQAIGKYQVPIPEIAVGDVGTSMYFYQNNVFQLHRDWSSEISKDWNGYSGNEIHDLLKDINSLTLQEPEKQNLYKQSYYTPLNLDKNNLFEVIQSRLKSKQIKAALIFSIDEQTRNGLLDILPISATKRHALEYLQKFFKVPFDQVIYAGDSGNDIDPLTSGYKAIVVKNARAEVKQEIKNIAKKKQILSQIYFAKGGFRNMCGNYTEGILEGLNHFGYLY